MGIISNFGAASANRGFSYQATRARFLREYPHMDSPMYLKMLYRAWVRVYSRRRY